jgi:hypothetical protein
MPFRALTLPSGEEAPDQAARDAPMNPPDDALQRHCQSNILNTCDGGGTARIGSENRGKSMVPKFESAMRAGYSILL